MSALLRLAAVLGTLALAACSPQDHFVYYPDTTRPDLVVPRLPAVREATLTTADGFGGLDIAIAFIKRRLAA